MDKTKLERQVVAMQAELDAMKRELLAPSAVIAVLMQKGVQYEVSDGALGVSPVVKTLHHFNPSGNFVGQCPDGAVGVSWRHHRVAFPQWINIPKDVPHDGRTLKGRVIIETHTGGVFAFNNVTGVDWKQVSRVCILDSQG